MTENERNLNKYSDGNSIVKYVTEASLNANTIGRRVIYTLIVVLWALTYSEENGKINASIWLIISFKQNIICLFRFLVLFLICMVLQKHFSEKNGGMAFRNEASCQIVDCKTKCWMEVGCYWSFLLMLLLFITAVPLIIHVASLSE